MNTEWKKVKLKEVSDFTTGKLNSNAAVAGGEYPFFTCSPETLQIDTYAFDQEALLLAGNNAEGNFSLKYYYGRFNAYQRTYVISSKDKNILDLKFLYYSLRLCLKLFKDLSQGTATKFLTASILNNFEIVLPPVDIQKSVTRILSAFDDKIELNTQINHNLEEQAKAILDQNCLAHKTLKVGDIVSFANGFAFKSSTYIEKGKFKVVTIKNVQDGKIDTSSADCVHEIPAKMKAECILNIGDVLLSLTGNVGRTGIVCENNLLLNQRVAKIIPHQSVLNAVCYFIFRRPEMKTALETIARGTAQANLSPVETLDIEIPFDIPTLQDIALCMKSFFEQIISNEMEIQKLAQLRDALLPKLMSGEIDVSEVEV